MSRRKKIIAIVLCLILLSSYLTYRAVNPNSALPDIIVVAYGQETDKTRRLKEEIGEGTIYDIQSMVTSCVAENLANDGFSCGTGIARTLENDNYSGSGVYYYQDGFNLFESDSLQSVGFVQVVSDTVKYEAPSEESSLISVVPADDTFAGKSLVCSHSYENITPSHFVYQGHYVSYYQQSPMRVVYSVSENATANYDFSLGSLYDFDRNRFIYDLSVMDEYQTHSALSLFTETDYQQLEATLREVSNQQYLNGYIVSEYRIVYISPESVQAYIDSKEEDTFYGYSTRELTEAFGYGTALVYTEDGFQSARIADEAESYNWKSFLTKVGIGCGILIIGAILAPVTGGASFGCALITATKITVGASLCAGLGTLAIQTAVGLASGKSIDEALRDASHSGLDAFANAFLITSVIASAGVATGVIKPSACFAAGTKVLTVNGAGQHIYKPIEQVVQGDSVCSMNTDNMTQSSETVLSIYRREVDQTIILTINDEDVETTAEHPFYCSEKNAWCSAENLKIGSGILLADGSVGVVSAKKQIAHKTPKTVYNLQVSNSHTYYVGSIGALVHNTCKDVISSMRSKAVREAWSREAEAVRAGVSKYNWSPSEVTQLLKYGKIRGYEGHHILTVKELVGTARESLIASADDIVFLSKAGHLYAHGGSTLNPTNLNNLVELLPWVVERFGALGIVF